MSELNFIKMHGLGNDFIVIDRRSNSFSLDRDVIKKISNRRTGIGCDQVIVIDQSKDKCIDGNVTIFNANGESSEACGNGVRCLSKILFDELNKKEINLKLSSRIINSELKKDKSISINMGKVSENWFDIPLNKEMDNRNIKIDIKNFSDGFAINIGNPHIVFIGENISKINLEDIGPKIECHDFFPNKINVEFVEVINENKIKMRVWERGVGETPACGSGACASVYAGYVKGLNKNNCEVILNNGSLFIDINNDNEIIMNGPAEISFYGKIDI